MTVSRIRKNLCPIAQEVRETEEDNNNGDNNCGCLYLFPMIIRTITLNQRDDVEIKTNIIIIITVIITAMAK